MAQRTLIVLAAAALSALAQAQSGSAPKEAPKEKINARALPQNNKPVLILSESWQHIPADVEHPVTQSAVTNPNLELKLYGDGVGGKDPDHGIWIVWHEQPQFEPLHLWTGLCKTNCAASLRDKYNYLDLRGNAYIRWDVKIAGLHMLRPILKLADGTWLVGDHVDSFSIDWHPSEFSIGDVRWRKLDINKVVEAPDGQWVSKPDLSKVDEIGFTDLMAGSGHGPGGWSDVGKIEVYGKGVPRNQ
jgi:hypothetical protein